MSKEYKDLIVGLDIGTTKVTCMVAEVRPDGRLSIVGLGTQPTSGLKRG
ncbi:MAG: cell division protein FtsA, partial [Betaproteobacteria bacterium]|nr:cell division protein FtsA [Betaproteobacteria bacterium]